MMRQSRLGVAPGRAPRNASYGLPRLRTEQLAPLVFGSLNVKLTPERLRLTLWYGYTMRFVVGAVTLLLVLDCFSHSLASFNQKPAM